MNTNAPIKISIITVCKNSKRFLTETIESVISQTYQQIQYIIIDGASSDGTLEIINAFSSKIDKWTSEPDGGMYEAINKGLQFANGDYILILNSDDVLADSNTIQKVVDFISEEKMDFYYGNMIKSKDGKNKKVKLFQVGFNQLLMSTHCTFAPHPCFLISSHLNKKLGGYDQRYKYASDYDYILRAMAARDSKGKYLNVFISKFRIHDESISASGKIDGERKKILAAHGYYKKPYLNRLFFYYILWIYYKIINMGNIYKID